MKLAPAPIIDSAMLSSAEAASNEATRYLFLQIGVAVIGCTIGPLVAIYVWVAGTAGAFSIGISAPDLVALLVWTIVMLPVLVSAVILGRKAALAGVPAISVAMRLSETGERPDLSRYPRMRYIIGRLVPGESGGS